MEKHWQLKDAVENLVLQGYVVHSEYSVGEEYDYEIIGGNTISITIKGKYYDPRWGREKKHNPDTLNRMFRNLIKDTHAEVISAPSTKELGYNDSLRRLYHHYPYGETDGSDAVLVNGKKEIVALQYNGMNKLSVIHSTGIQSMPDYIVINNNKKLKGNYLLSDYEDLIPIIQKVTGC